MGMPGKMKRLTSAFPHSTSRVPRRRVPRRPFALSVTRSRPQPTNRHVCTQFDTAASAIKLRRGSHKKPKGGSSSPGNRLSSWRWLLPNQKSPPPMPPPWASPPPPAFSSLGFGDAPAGRRPRRYAPAGAPTTPKPRARPVLAPCSASPARGLARGRLRGEVGVVVIGAARTEVAQAEATRMSVVSRLA
jgi:hypothetical protein